MAIHTAVGQQQPKRLKTCKKWAQKVGQDASGWPLHMGVSKNGGIQKWMVYTGKPY